uniref:Uncharacterized protein n=1 Tax=Rhizophagus irregularis (strain DAOM 181602 / DAOM 197198 / MUCL 43194) TaxID=747089 RepID=U9U2R3_RHIID
MNTFESNIQESVNKTERILKQVYHQDDTNDEQVKTSNIAFQNLESEDKIISSSYIYYNQQKNDVDVVMEIYGKKYEFVIIKK